MLKPGGYVLAFAGSRTYGLMEMSIRLAGFEIRDQMQWLYGSGFPQSLDVSKAIDKAAGVAFSARPASGVGFMGPDGPGGYNVTKNQLLRVGDSTDDAKKWQGWGTALKPAHEPIVVARKPLSEKTVAANVLKHGTGAINIDVQGRRRPRAANAPQPSSFGREQHQFDTARRFSPARFWPLAGERDPRRGSRATTRRAERNHDDREAER